MQNRKNEFQQKKQLTGNVRTADTNSPKSISLMIVFFGSVMSAMRTLIAKKDLTKMQKGIFAENADMKMTPLSTI